MSDESNISQLALGSHQVMGGIVAVIVAAFAFFRWLLGLAGARQDKRIALLEARVGQADNRSMALAQVIMALIPIVESSHPEHPALTDAKSVLKKAFPADAPDHSEA